MTLTDHFMQSNIFVDSLSEIEYGWDQAYVSYPTVFATVGLEIVGGSGLCNIVDRIRMDEGTLAVALPDDGYRFFVGLNDYTDSKVDTLIIAKVDAIEAADFGLEYPIDLSREEQHALYRRLDEECEVAYGKSCEDLLAEARNRMERERLES